MLTETLRSLALGAGLGDAAIELTELTGDGRTAAVDSVQPIYPASMIKTPLAVAAAMAEDAGRIGWADRIVVDPDNMTTNDAPSPLVPGAVATIRELVELMLARSDNVATNMLIDVLGRERASADLAALGFATTAIRRKLSGALPLIADPQASGRNTHPAADACTLFARIARNDVPGAAFIEAVLAMQYWNTKLTCGLEPGDRFAHKTGDTDEVSHDGGILTLASKRRYAIVVYTLRASDDETDRCFGDFMRGLRPHLL